MSSIAGTAQCRERSRLLHVVLWPSTHIHFVAAATQGPTTASLNIPNASAINRKAKRSPCLPGLTLCPHYAGIGGYECVNTHRDVESCGGCVGFEGEGEDCTTIQDLSEVACVKKRCVVRKSIPSRPLSHSTSRLRLEFAESCIRGFKPSDDKRSCVSTTPNRKRWKRKK